MTQLFTIIASIAVVVIGWYLNERSKRKWELYKRKEDNYKELIRTLRGFYQEISDNELRKEFLNELNLCWLYSSDEVIKSAYSFLDTVHTDTNSSDENKERALSSLMLAMRTDLLSGKTVEKSKLTADAFRHLRAT